MKPTPYDHSRFWKYVSIALAALLVYVPIHAFVSTWLGTSIGPLWLWKGWKEIAIVLLVLASLIWVIWRRELTNLLKDRVIQVIGTYLIIVILCTIAGNAQTDAKFVGAAMDLRYIALFTVAYALARFAPRLRMKWLERTPRVLVSGGLVLVVLGVLQVAVMPLDFLTVFGYDKNETIAPYLLIDDNPNAPRAFATLRGPNDYAAYLIVPLTFAVIYMVRLRDKILMSLAFIAGLAVSASRSAWIGAAAAVVSAGLLMKSLSRRHLVLLAGSGVVVAMLALYAAVSIPSVRLAVFHSSPGDSSLTEGSTDAHWQATANGVERVAQDPVNGCGAGCAGPASYYNDEARISENYYVQLAETYGVIGLIVWLTLFSLVMWRLWKSDATMATPLLASGIGLSIIGLWLHVWSDDPLSITWWVLVGIVIGNVSSKSRTKPVQ